MVITLDEYFGSLSSLGCKGDFGWLRREKREGKERTGSLQIW